MKRIFLVVSMIFFLAGCSQNLTPPVYPHSVLDVTINTKRYIEPVMQKGQMVLTETLILEQGGSSLSQLEKDVEETQRAIAEAKVKFGQMTYPSSMEEEKSAMLKALTILSNTLDHLIQKAKSKEDFHAEYLTLQADLGRLQGESRVP